MIQSVTNTVPRTCVISVISNLNGVEIVGTFCKEELQKANQKEFRFEKVIKKKGDKLYRKWTIGLIVASIKTLSMNE